MKIDKPLKRIIFLWLLIKIGMVNATAQSMGWVFLEGGDVNVNCTSTSNCSNNEICYGLVYIPAVSGVITSYTTGFFIDCVPSGVPVLSSASCIMTTNTSIVDACASNSIILLAASGNSGNPGTSTITAGQPITIHQVCFSLAENESINIVEDETTDLTTSIDLSGGGAGSEFPSYSTFQADHNTPCSILAVNLKSFEVSKKEEIAYLTWTTSTETNNDYFSIEWSTDGRSFNEIGILKGAGHSNDEQYYHFNHLKPFSGINYYRLKAVEYDGAFQYSVIKSVQFSTKESPISNIFPNPVKDKLSITIDNKVLDEPYTIKIRSVTGQLLLKQKQYTDDKIIHLALNGLQTGTYLLVIESKHKTYVERFIKIF